MAFDNKIKTVRGEIYAIGAETETNSYVEIGYINAEGEYIQVAAIDVRSETITGTKDDPMMLTIYDQSNLDNGNHEVREIIY